MAWLQKRNQINVVASSFSMGMNKTLLIVGLGNPGTEFNNTRHNIGFECIDYFANTVEEIGEWTKQKNLDVQIARGNLSDKGIFLIKPQTFMNNSGVAVQKVANYYKIGYSDILIVHDEIDLDFGQIRSKFGGGNAGHNGIKSIEQALSSKEFNRIRIGIKNDILAKSEAKDFVLNKFNKDETTKLTDLKKEVSSIIMEFIYSEGQITAETRSFLY